MEFWREKIIFYVRSRTEQRQLAPVVMDIQRILASSTARLFQFKSIKPLKFNISDT